MIVRDLNFIRLSAAPAKADTPLIIDSNAVLPRSVSRKLLQPVARWRSKIHQGVRRVDDLQLALGDPLQAQGELPRALTSENPLRMSVTEGPDQGSIITHGVTNVKRYYSA